MAWVSRSREPARRQPAAGVHGTGPCGASPTSPFEGNLRGFQFTASGARVGARHHGRAGLACHEKSVARMLLNAQKQAQNSSKSNVTRSGDSERSLTKRGWLGAAGGPSSVRRATRESTPGARCRDPDAPVFGALPRFDCWPDAVAKRSRADCEHFFNKNVEVKLKSEGIVDPVAVAKRQAELRASLNDDLDKCVGRRITDSMLRCVDNAQTDTDIDKCLR